MIPMWEDIVVTSGDIVKIVAALGILSTCVVWFRRIVEGIRCQLRTAMLSTYYKCKDERKIRQYEAENFEKNYHAYKALKGNSFIDEIYERAHEWEVLS